MPGVVAQVEVDAPPAVVFPWIAEPTLLRRWVGGLEHLRADGVLRWELSFRHRGAIVAMRADVRALVVPERLEVTLWGPARLRIDLSATVEAAPGGRTLARLALAADRTGLAQRLAGGIVDRELRATAGTELERLRRAVADAAGPVAAA